MTEDLITEGTAGVNSMSSYEMIGDTHRMVQEMHTLCTQAAAAVAEMQNSGGGMMGMMMKMMSGKKS